MIWADLGPIASPVSGEPSRNRRRATEKRLRMARTAQAFGTLSFRNNGLMDMWRGSALFPRNPICEPLYGACISSSRTLFLPAQLRSRALPSPRILRRAFRKGTHDDRSRSRETGRPDQHTTCANRSSGRQRGWARPCRGMQSGRTCYRAQVNLRRSTSSMTTPAGLMARAPRGQSRCRTNQPGAIGSATDTSAVRGIPALPNALTFIQERPIR